jgi:hypothetical protein
MFKSRYVPLQRQPGTEAPVIREALTTWRGKGTGVPQRTSWFVIGGNAADFELTSKGVEIYVQGGFGTTTIKSAR